MRNYIYYVHIGFILLLYRIYANYTYAVQLGC